MFRPYRVKLALVDLNGTCHVGDNLIKGSNLAIKRLLDSGVKVRYVTNTTKESTDSILKRCQDLELADDRVSIHSCIG